MTERFFVFKNQKENALKDRIKEIRKAERITQKELAERLGVAQATVGGWESGAKNVPAAQAYRIASEFNVNLEWLKTGVGEMYRTPADRRELQRAIFLEILESFPAPLALSLIDAMREYLREHRPDVKLPPVELKLVAKSDDGLDDDVTA